MAALNAKLDLLHLPEFLALYNAANRAAVLLDEALREGDTEKIDEALRLLTAALVAFRES